MLDQVKAIQRNSDFEVAVFVGGGKTDSSYEVDGVTVHRYKTHEMPSNILNGFFNDYNAQSFVKRVLALGIDPIDVAFVHCHVSMRAACGLALKRLNPRIKVLVQHHDLDPFNLRSGVIGRGNRFNIRYRAKKAIRLYNEVDLHICISEACRECLHLFPNPRKGEVYEDCKRSLTLCNGLPSIHPKATYVLYNGVDVNRFHHVGGIKTTDVFKIGCVSNFNELKGHITLVQAVEKMVNDNPAVKILVSFVGSGETKSFCQEYIKEHQIGKYFVFEKEMPHEMLPSYFNSLDLFVLPSYFEGFGCVYTEAAACGVPFIGCYNQGYSEYISDSDKKLWLIEPHDSKQLSILIKRQMEEPVKQSLIYPYDIDILIVSYLKYLVSICV